MAARISSGKNLCAHAESLEKAAVFFLTHSPAFAQPRWFLFTETAKSPANRPKRTLASRNHFFATKIASSFNSLPHLALFYVAFTKVCFPAKNAAKKAFADRFIHRLRGTCVYDQCRQNKGVRLFYWKGHASWLLPAIFHAPSHGLSPRR
ncbi:MAG: hypothetical protein SFW62_07610 [Alphaproteobacteria bacterium]|nr:hypothetical protein [Alphaproteobacteria bacterium]